MGFTGKVAIVTGAAAGGIGEGMARAIANEGAKVMVADINEAGGVETVDAIRRAGGEAAFSPLDIGSPESAERMAENTVKAFGKINYLVNNAALFNGMPNEGLMEMDWPLLLKMFNLNALGGLCVTRAVAPHMRREGGGAIVNTSSTAAYFSVGHYGVSKLAVNGVTIALSRELGPMNIRVNAIAPGPTDTAGLRHATPDGMLDSIIARMPIKRLGTPDDLARAVIFLLSDNASWMTGAIVNVDGGHVARI